MNQSEIEHLFRGSATPPSRALPGEPPFTTRAGTEGDLRYGRLDALARNRGRDVDSEKGGNALTPLSRRASRYKSSSRAWRAGRRRADYLLRREGG